MATTIKKDIYMTSLGEVAYFTICDDECGSVVLSALGAGVCRSLTGTASIGMWLSAIRRLRHIATTILMPESL